MPIADICKQIDEDFDKYILPELCAIGSYEEFLELQAKKLEEKILIGRRLMQKN